MNTNLLKHEPYTLNKVPGFFYPSYQIVFEEGSLTIDGLSFENALRTCQLLNGAHRMGVIATLATAEVEP
jgi:hypothetical protein